MHPREQLHGNRVDFRKSVVSVGALRWSLTPSAITESPINHSVILGVKRSRIQLSIKLVHRPVQISTVNPRTKRYAPKFSDIDILRSVSGLHFLQVPPISVILAHGFIAIVASVHPDGRIHPAEWDAAVKDSCEKLVVFRDCVVAIKSTKLSVESRGNVRGTCCHIAPSQRCVSRRCAPVR